MGSFHYTKGFEKVLKQCQETIERFEGSEETLKHIRRMEESLKSLLPKQIKEEAIARI